MALLFPRPGELRNSAWEEFDLKGSVWTVPAVRMKMRRPHRVPLSRQAVGILTDLRETNGTGVLLFPSVRSASRPISDNTLNAALRRMGYSKDEATAHGFRAAGQRVSIFSRSCRKEAGGSTILSVSRLELARASRTVSGGGTLSPAADDP